MVAVLDSSETSKRFPSFAGKADARRFGDVDHSRGHRGGVIPMHRALARFVLEPLDLVLSVLLVLLFSFVWLACLPWVCRSWEHIFENVLGVLDIGIAVGLSEHRLTPYLHFFLPYPRMDNVGPGPGIWWLTLAAVAVLFLGSFLLPKSLLPVAYLLRGLLFIQTSSLLYFALAPGRFPHTPDGYMEGFVTYGMALISFVPLLYGLTYYIFNFGLIRKFLLTALTMIHLSVFFPLQVLVQAIILQKSLLFMPALYIAFGMPVDVLVVIAFYSWGMSWASKTARVSTRGNI